MRVMKVKTQGEMDDDINRNINGVDDRDVIEIVVD